MPGTPHVLGFRNETFWMPATLKPRQGDGLAVDVFMGPGAGCSPGAVGKFGNFHRGRGVAVPEDEPVDRPTGVAFAATVQVGRG